MSVKELYERASELDSQGKEVEAIEYYEKAYAGINELSEEDQIGLMLGMGSTYRWINKLEKSEKVFDKAVENFPSAVELKVFRSLTRLDLGKEKQAFCELLEVLLSESSSKPLKLYERALQHQVRVLQNKD